METILGKSLVENIIETFSTCLVARNPEDRVVDSTIGCWGATGR